MKKLIKPIVKDNREIPYRVQNAIHAQLKEFEYRKTIIELADNLRYLDSREEWRQTSLAIDRAASKMIWNQSEKETLIEEMSDLELKLYETLT